MERQEAMADARLTERLREALSPALPYGASLIPLDILVVVACAHYANQPLSVKQLLAVLPYSVTGIRYNLAQLVADGWLIKSRFGEDRRLVHLLPSERVAIAFSEVRAALLSTMDDVGDAS